MNEVTVKQLKEMIDNGEDFQLIDVREPHEVDIASIEGSTLIPLGEIAHNKDKIAKDKQVVIFCRSGARSGQAVSFLTQQLSADNLYNLKGGILAWSDEIDPSVQKY